MAKKRFYAVKQGRKPGIYATWADAEAQVKGYPDAKFKGFPTREEAEDWLGETSGKPTAEDDGAPYAYVDGSFNADTNTYGYGGFLHVDGRDVVLQGSGDDPEDAQMRNVAGEIEGAMAAVRLAEQMGLSRLEINYDYQGICKWADGSWKANKPGTRRYRDFMRAAQTVMDITFRHTPGHTGIPGNERADRLAKEAVGL